MENAILNYSQVSNTYCSAIREKNEEQEQFQAKRLASAMNAADLPRSPRKSDRFYLIWVKAGKGFVRIDCENHHFQADQIFCISPGQVFQYAPEAVIHGYVIAFVPEFINLDKDQKNGYSWLEQYQRLISQPVIALDQKNRSEMDELVRQMDKELQNKGLLRPEILKGLLHLFVLYFSGRPCAATCVVIDKDRELVRKFMSLLKEKFTSKKMVSDYAEELFVTPNYLNRTVKKVSGHTASYHIQQQIVLEAKRQAMYAGISMKEIAYQLGFDNLAHFSKFFKNNSGTNFTSFKKDLLIFT